MEKHTAVDIVIVVAGAPESMIPTSRLAVIRKVTSRTEVDSRTMRSRILFRRRPLRQTLVYDEESVQYDPYTTNEAREGLDVLLLFLSSYPVTSMISSQAAVHRPISSPCRPAVAVFIARSGDRIHSTFMQSRGASACPVEWDFR